MTQLLGRAARRIVSRRRIGTSDLSTAVAGTMVMVRLFDVAGVIEPARAREFAQELLSAARGATAERVGGTRS